MVSNIGIFLEKYSALSQYNDAHEPLHGIMVYRPVGRGGGGGPVNFTELLENIK